VFCAVLCTTIILNCIAKPSRLAWSEGRRPLGAVLHLSHDALESVCACYGAIEIVVIIIIIIKCTFV